MNNIENKPYYTTGEASKILKISRIAVFYRIKSGDLKAQKIGRNYLIPREVLAYKLGKMTDKRKKEIDKDIQLIATEYGEALRLLGKE